MLMSSFYVIEIPENTAVLLTMENKNDVAYISTFPYYSFISSPYYGMTDVTLCQDDLDNLQSPIIYKVNDIYAKFTMSSYNISEQFAVCMTVNETETVYVYFKINKLLFKFVFR